MRMLRAIASSFLIMLICNATFSANRLYLTNQPTTILQSFTPQTNSNSQEAITLKEVNRYTDNNQMTHIRMQEYYGQYPVLNAQAVIHLPFEKTKQKTLQNILRTISNEESMNGNLYKDFATDLAQTPQWVLTKHASRAIEMVTNHFKSKQDKANSIHINHVLSNTIIWIDDNHQAHWAYEVTFYANPTALGKLPSKPTYIIDAYNLSIYNYWDNIHSIDESNFVTGGGWGGNPNAGKLAYDGLPDHLSTFIVKRENNACYLENSDIMIRHAITKNIMQYPCLDKDDQHNHVYWSGDFDYINEGYSPANDAMFSAQVIKEFYKSWYKISALVNADGTEMMLVMDVHVPKMDNAYWDGEGMTFGDGEKLYPLTSLGVAAHEVSHGFTQQHSNLDYVGQSGGMNEAFSDMAAQVAEFYVYNRNTWQIGSELFKIDGEALRFMDKPSKDCYGKAPGTFCSIDNANQYYEGLDVHYSSGVYNRAFYLLSNMPEWNPRKAFAVMLQANAGYWVNTTQYADGAACAIRAAEDLHYDKNAVEDAFKAVGISNFDNCTNHD